MSISLQYETCYLPFVQNISTAAEFTEESRDSGHSLPARPPRSILALSKVDMSAKSETQNFICC